MRYIDISDFEETFNRLNTGTTFKDWLDVKKCETFEKLKLEVDKEMKFYNELRPQWSLNKKPPRLYRGFVLNNF